MNCSHCAVNGHLFHSLRQRCEVYQWLSLCLAIAPKHRKLDSCDRVCRVFPWSLSGKPAKTNIFAGFSPPTDCERKAFGKLGPVHTTSPRGQGGRGVDSDSFLSSIGSRNPETGTRGVSLGSACVYAGGGLSGRCRLRARDDERIVRWRASAASRGSLGGIRRWISPGAAIGK